MAAVHVKFESQDAVAWAMSASGMGPVLADVANYTNITPVIQTSEIVVG